MKLCSNTFYDYLHKTDRILIKIVYKKFFLVLKGTSSECSVPCRRASPSTCSSSGCPADRLPTSSRSTDHSRNPSSSGTPNRSSSGCTTFTRLESCIGTLKVIWFVWLFTHELRFEIEGTFFTKFLIRVHDIVKITLYFWNVFCKIIDRGSMLWKIPGGMACLWILLPFIF